MKYQINRGHAPLYLLLMVLGGWGLFTLVDGNLDSGEPIKLNEIDSPKSRENIKKIEMHGKRIDEVVEPDFRSRALKPIKRSWEGPSIPHWVRYSDQTAYIFSITSIAHKTIHSVFLIVRMSKTQKIILMAEYREILKLLTQKEGWKFHGPLIDKKIKITCKKNNCVAMASMVLKTIDQDKN